MKSEKCVTTYDSYSFTFFYVSDKKKSEFWDYLMRVGYINLRNHLRPHNTLSISNKIILSKNNKQPKPLART